MTQTTPQDAQSALSAPQQLLETVKGHIETLAAQLEQGQSQALLEYLNFVGRFHHYSLNNQLLIWLQAPSAAHVAGYNAWKAMGRQVKKGAKAVRILAPVIRDDGQGERVVTGFRYVNVFADFDTEGDALPASPLRTLEGGSPELLEALIHACPLPVVWRDCGTADGRTDGKTIYLDPRACAGSGHATHVLFHEWAHTVLHFVKGDARDRAQCELEADATGYVLCAQHGIDARAAVSDYLASWGGKPDALRAALERITYAVRVVLSELDKEKAPRPQSLAA